MSLWNRLLLNIGGLKQNRMKKVIEFIEDYSALLIGGAIAFVFCWFVYKVAAGLYHLMEKLIDKVWSAPNQNLTVRLCKWIDPDESEPCMNMCEGKTDYCASHNFALRKAARVKTKVVVPVKKITEKRAKQNREYLEMVKDFLIQYPMCQVRDCVKPSAECHHIQGRSNDLLTNPENFMAVCSDCHKKITEHSAWAIENGYSKLRSIWKNNS